MIRILLVDDHAVVRSGYQRFLQRHPDLNVVAEAGHADDAYTAYGQHLPDVAVVDLSMAGVGGLELIRRLVERHSSARTLVFSMHDDPLFVTRALQAGACGYVTKGSEPDVLVQAVRAVHAGQRFFSADVLPHAAGICPTLTPLSELSAKEFEVFRLLAQGLASSDVAQSMHLSPKTVANYKTQIKDKLGAATTAKLVHIAWRHGVLATPL